MTFTEPLTWRCPAISSDASTLFNGESICFFISSFLSTFRVNLSSLLVCYQQISSLLLTIKLVLTCLFTRKNSSRSFDLSERHNPIVFLVFYSRNKFNFIKFELVYVLSFILAFHSFSLQNWNQNKYSTLNQLNGFN